MILNTFSRSIVAVLASATSAFAAFTETEFTTDQGNTGGYTIKGTGSTADLAHNPYAFMAIVGTLNIDDSTDVQTTAGDTKMGGPWSYYTLSLNGALNCTGSGKLILAEHSTAWVYSGISMVTKSSLTVSATSGGIQAQKVYTGGNNIVLNLDKEDAIYSSRGSFMFTNTNNSASVAPIVNMSADQHMNCDFRTNSITKFNITNGATLFIVNRSVNTDGISANLYLSDNLSDGKIAFLKDFVSSVDETKNEISIFSSDSTPRNETLMLFNGDGSALSNVMWTSETIGGKDYWVISAAVPEPAEWAAAFGALALALAVYRRRARK